MLLSQLVDTFLSDYKLETKLRQTEEIRFSNKQIASMFGKVVSDIQKDFGVIRLSEDISLIAGTSKYSLTSSYMKFDNVKLGDIPLNKKSKEWVENQSSTSGTPTDFTIIYETAIPQIWLYPTPVNIDTLTVYYTPDFNLFNPTDSTTQDLGTFDGESFSGNTVFPTQYDNLLILGLMKRIFKDIETEYQKEKMRLKCLQFSGEKFDYNMTGIIE